MHAYAVFTHTGDMVPASSVDEAKRLVRERYPAAHFTAWFDVVRGRNLPAWQDSAHALLYELGETGDDNKPVAYVRVQDWEVRTLR